MTDINVGNVLCVETNNKKKVKDNWFPGLIVAPTTPSSVRINIAKEYLVRSFTDGKYYSVQKKESLKLYTSEIGHKVENQTLKTAVKKAELFITKNELPSHWNRNLLFGTDKCITMDSECFYDNNDSNKKFLEEKDHFVAMLFKFMDDRGTPLNQVPNINGKDLDLFKLYKIVTLIGGCNKVTNLNQWNFVSLKMGEDDQNISFKEIYEQHLHSFEDFDRQRGYTMLSYSRDVKSHSRLSRNIVRDYNKALPDKYKQTSVKQVSKEKINKSETMKKAEIFKGSGTIKKNSEGAKSDEKCNKTSESSEMNDKKIDDVCYNTSRDISKKCMPDILGTEDFKAKNQLKEIVEQENESKQDDIETDAGKKEPKKKSARYLIRKSVKNPQIEEKVVKVEQEKTCVHSLFFKPMSVKLIIPANRVRRVKPPEFGNTIKLYDNSQKSKCKEVPNRSRSMSAQSDINSTSILPGLSGLAVENLSRAKKVQNISEEKKLAREKNDEKEDKLISNDFMTSPIYIGSSEVQSPLEDPSSEITVGDHVVVNYNDVNPITYEAKVLKVAVIEGILKYRIHFIGWNSRYDEWIESTRIALKLKGSVKKPEHDEANILKIKQKSADLKKTTSTNKRKKSATTSLSNSSRKKLPFSSVRPTSTFTLNHHSSSTINNCHSKSDVNRNIELTKKIIKRQQIVHSTKFKQDIALNTEYLDIDNQKEVYPNTYPNKDLHMQRNKSTTPVDPVKQSEIEIKDFLLHNKSDSESNTSENMISNDMILGTLLTNKVKKDSQNKICHSEIETNIKGKALDLNFNSPASNVIDMLKPNKINDIIAIDNNDDDDDDKLKLVIAENNKNDNDYQMDTNQIILGEETKSSNDKSNFKFGSNSKSPTNDCTENIESAFKVPFYKSLNNEKPEVMVNYGNENIRDNHEKKILPGFQYRAKILVEETINNALATEYNRNNLEWNIHKPYTSTSKDFLDSVNQPSFYKDGFYGIDPECNTKNSFSEHRQTNLVKRVISDTYSPSTSKSLFDQNNTGYNIKDRFYDKIPSSSKLCNSVPSTNKNCNNADAEVNNILFCEETIPGSPNETFENHYVQEERKGSNESNEILEVREAASIICSMKTSFKRSMNTLMGTNKKELEGYTNVYQSDGELLELEYLQLLAEISCRNLSINTNDSSEKNSAEETTKPSGISYTEHNNSNHEHLPNNLNDTSFTALTEGSVENSVPYLIPLKNASQ